MGTDDIHHNKPTNKKNRKARKVNELKRGPETRGRNPRVLIVCEGSKTEPKYFEDLRDSLGIHKNNVIICGEECGSAPSSIFKYAEKLYTEDKKTGHHFDRVYCVFDKDTHTSYQPTLEAIARKREKDIWHATTSIPCFEYWILLHFSPTSKPFHPSGNRSASQNVKAEIRNRHYISEYSEGMKGVFTLLLPRLESAKKNATRLLAAAEASGTDNPSTKVHELVGYLQNLKQ
ncbi:RloB family protein [Parathalassolituus penaei]|uniref:RloB family protein n=1 Tax=Parathalassolituus penaei TaxID=2997323 RepID=A0A9X3ECX6_9GAMM|nr:RloB family protein [Parathalassolituus penaei]MCY0964860.1 RloB family protein [Parathalassolituus penaei]